ncbi:NADH-quinone oxidoreductase subunit M [bacterium]|nr:NADH-quinone oxidoreductase subunit M [bacterium]
MLEMTSLLSLNILIFSPIAAAIITASPMFGTNPIYIRRFSKSFLTIHFLYSLLFVAFYNFSSESFYDEITVSGNSWLSKLGINAAFGADGFTILLCMFTSLIFLLTLIISKTMIRTKHKMYYTLMHLLLCTTLGIFCAKDMFVFLLFWQAELIPMYLLISQWGSNNSKNSAMKYVLYNFIGSIFISLSMVALYYYGYHSNGTLSSSIDFLRIYQADNIFPLLLQKLIFWCLFIGFALKLPIIPIHTYYVSLIGESVTPVSIVTSSILINTAAYGIIRFNLDLFPELFSQYAPIIMIIGVINIIWASLSAFKQKDIAKFSSYINITYMGLFLLGLSSLNKSGFDGAIFIIFSNIFIASALSLFIGLLYQTFKTKSLYEIKALGKFAPNFMLLGYLIIFAVIGVPLTIGFAGDFLVFAGSFSADFQNALLPKICSFTALLSVIFLASCSLNLFNQVFSGFDNSDKKYHDISGHRLTVLFILCFCIILFGIFPNSIMNLYNNVTEMLVEILRV